VLARRHWWEYQRYREQARRQVAPGSASVEVWDRARAQAMAEFGDRYRAEWHRRYRQLRAAHPELSPHLAAHAASNRVRAAHRRELTELTARYAAATPAGRKLVSKITARAWRQLQLAHPEEFRALYAIARAQLGNTPTEPAGARNGRTQRSRIRGHPEGVASRSTSQPPGQPPDGPPF
jgi:hypothetical protein